MLSHGNRSDADEHGDRVTIITTKLGSRRGQASGHLQRCRVGTCRLPHPIERGSLSLQDLHCPIGGLVRHRVTE